ncbi:hypothetical protein THAOC_23292, partial [Thalassiosira oceanica]
MSYERSASDWTAIAGTIRGPDLSHSTEANAPSGAERGQRSSGCGGQTAEALRETTTVVTTADDYDGDDWAEGQGVRSTAAARDVWARVACSPQGEMADNDWMPAMPDGDRRAARTSTSEETSSCLLLAPQSPAGRSERRRASRERRSVRLGRGGGTDGRPRTQLAPAELPRGAEHSGIRGCSNGGQSRGGLSSAQAAPSSHSQ